MDRAPASADTPPPQRALAAARPILALILLLALFLRLYGINYGLPHLYYWDEPTVVNRAIRFASRDFNPHFFYYPTFYMYVLFVVSGGYYVVERLSGHYHSAQQFAAEFFLNPTRLYLTLRAFTALVGVGVVLVTYFAAKRYFGRTAGIVAALFMAVSTLQVSHAHLAITDTPHTLFVAAALIPLHSVWKRGHARDYALAGALIGLGIATKYLAGLHVCTLLAAHLLRPADHPGQPLPQRVFNRNILLGLTAVFAGFFAGAPYCMLDFHTFLRDYKTQALISQHGPEPSSMPFLLGIVLPADLGSAILALSGAGLLVVLVRRRRRSDLVFLIFPAVYTLLLLRYPRGFSRYMIPVDPFLCSLAGVAVAAILRRLRASGPTRLALAGALCGVAIFQPLRLDLKWDRWMAGPEEARTTALGWADQHIPSGAPIALHYLFNRSFLDAHVLTDVRLAKIDHDMPAGGQFGAVKQSVLAELHKRPVYIEKPFVQSFDQLKREGAHYFFSFRARQYNPEGALDPSFQRDLDTRSKEIHRFGGTPAGMRGFPPRAASVFPVFPDGGRAGSNRGGRRHP